MSDFYTLPFSKARPYLQRVYLNLDFLDHHQLSAADLNLKVIYTPTGLVPAIIVNNAININNYTWVGPAEKHPEPYLRHKGTWTKIGYKHFDKWKFEDGAQIGDFQSSKNREAKKLQYLIQRHVLGFWKFWSLRLLGKI